MTVGELIAELGKLPAGLPVIVDIDGITWDAREVRVLTTTVTRGQNVGENDVTIECVEII